jgi:hypothetical protein
MNDVGIVFAPEKERVPDCVTRQSRSAVTPPERSRRQLDVVPASELVHQALEISRRARTCLNERGDVDRYAHHSASA